MIMGRAGGSRVPRLKYLCAGTAQPPLAYGGGPAGAGAAVAETCGPAVVSTVAGRRLLRRWRWWVVAVEYGDSGMLFVAGTAAAAAAWEAGSRSPLKTIAWGTGREGMVGVLWPLAMIFSPYTSEVLKPESSST